MCGKGYKSIKLFRKKTEETTRGSGGGSAVPGKRQTHLPHIWKKRNDEKVMQQGRAILGQRAQKRGEKRPGGKPKDEGARLGRWVGKGENPSMGERRERKGMKR